MGVWIEYGRRIKEASWDSISLSVCLGSTFALFCDNKPSSTPFGTAIVCTLPLLFNRPPRYQCHIINNTKVVWMRHLLIIAVTYSLFGCRYLFTYYLGNISLSPTMTLIFICTIATITASLSVRCKKITNY